MFSSASPFAGALGPSRPRSDDGGRQITADRDHARQSGMLRRDVVEQLLPGGTMDVHGECRRVVRQLRPESLELVLRGQVLGVVRVQPAAHGSDHPPDQQAAPPTAGEEAEQTPGDRRRHRAGDDSPRVSGVDHAFVVDAQDHFVDDRSDFVAGSAATIDPSAELPTALAGALVTLEAREQDLELRIVDGAHAHPA